DWTPKLDVTLKEPRAIVLIPGARIRYLAEIAEQGRAINAAIEKQAEAADRAQACWQALQELQDPRLPKQLDLHHADDLTAATNPVGAASAASPSSEGKQDQKLAAEAAPTNAEAPAPDRSLLTLRQRYNDALQSL